MTAPVYRQFDVWALLSIRPWPETTSPPTVLTYRFAMQPYADRDVYRPFAEGRIPKSGGVGDVTRAMSSIDAQYEVDTWTVHIIDTDGLIRGLLADDTTNVIDQGRWEVTFELVSHEGRLNEVDPRTLFRGIVTEVTPEQGRMVTIQAKDLLGGHLKGFDLDSPVPFWKLKDDFGDLDEFPEALNDQIAPSVYGENSDHGTVDVSGNSAEKGLVPVFYVGKTLISDGLPGTPPTAPVYLSPPSNLRIVPFGGGATHTVRGAVSAITNFGETLLSNIVTVSNYPVNPGPAGAPTVGAVWTWDAPSPNGDQAIAYNVYVIDDSSTATPRYRLDQMNNGATFVNPELTYTDDKDDSHFKTMYPGPVGVNTAQVAAGDPGVPGSGPMFFHTFIVAGYGALPFIAEASGSPGVEAVEFFGADLSPSGTGTRIQLDASVANSGIRNVQIIAPGDDLWPHADNWIERNGRRYSGFYARGALANAHINGAVAFALNIGGYTETPDGLGNIIDQAGFVAQHFLTNQCGLDPTNPTYTNGDTWNDIPEFSDGTPKLRPIGFATFQMDGEARMSTSLGPLCRFVIAQPMTLRDWLTKFAWTFNAFWVTNHHGQLFPVLLPHSLAAGSGTLFRDRIEIKQWLTPTMDRQVVTEVTGVYDYDTEAQTWRRADATIKDDDLEDANGGRPKTRDRIEMPFTGDPHTFDVSLAYWLALLKKARRFQPFEVGYLGLEVDLADAVRTTHYDGIGTTGETEKLGILAKHGIATSRDTVILTALDVSQLDVPDIAGVSVLPESTDSTSWPDFSEGRLWSEAA